MKKVTLAVLSSLILISVVRSQSTTQKELARVHTQMAQLQSKTKQRLTLAKKRLANGDLIGWFEATNSHSDLMYQMRTLKLAFLKKLANAGSGDAAAQLRGLASEHYSLVREEGAGLDALRHEYETKAKQSEARGDLLAARNQYKFCEVVLKRVQALVPRVDEALRYTRKTPSRRKAGVEQMAPIPDKQKTAEEMRYDDGQLAEATVEHERFMRQARQALDESKRLLAAGDLGGSYAKQDCSNTLLYGGYMAMINHLREEARGGDRQAEQEMREYVDVLLSALRQQDKLLWDAFNDLTEGADLANARGDMETGLHLLQLANGRLRRKKIVNGQLVSLQNQLRPK